MRWEEPSRRAKMECLPAFHSGPTGALGVQKLWVIRFKFCAWVCRTNAPGLLTAAIPLGCIAHPARKI